MHREHIALTTLRNTTHTHNVCSKANIPWSAWASASGPSYGLKTSLPVRFSNPIALQLANTSQTKFRTHIYTDAQQPAYNGFLHSTPEPQQAGYARLPVEWLRRACEQSAIIYLAIQDSTGQTWCEEAGAEEMV